MDKSKIIGSIKGVYKSVRMANFRHTGIIATRVLVLTMLVPIMLVVIEYIMAFAKGYVSVESNRLIDVGINIIDHIFIPSVLTALVGFLALWVDKDGDGIPDQLEKEDKR